MLYFTKPFSMVPMGRLGHLGCGTVPTSLKMAWHYDPACRCHRPWVRYCLPCPPPHTYHHHQVENIVAIELAYINTKHPDFYHEANRIGGMLKSPDMEAEARGQVTSRAQH